MATGASRSLVYRDTRFVVIVVLAAAVVSAVFIFFAVVGAAMFSWGVAGIGLVVFAVAYAVDIVRALFPGLPRITADSPDPRGRAGYEAVARICEAARIPMPRVYLDSSEDPNAFTYGFGANHSVVILTQGLLDLIGDDAQMLQAVAAHEVGHMLSFDCAIFTALIFPIHVMTWVANFVRAMAHFLSAFIRPIIAITIRMSSSLWGIFIGLMIAFMVVGVVLYLFIAAGLILAAVALCTMFVNLLKREREYAADATGLRLTGDRAGSVALLAHLLDIGPQEREVLAVALGGFPGPDPRGDTLPDFGLWPNDRYAKIGLGNALRELFLDHPYVVRRIGNLNQCDRLGEPQTRHGDLVPWVLVGLLVIASPFAAPFAGNASLRTPTPEQQVGQPSEHQRTAQALTGAQQMVEGITGEQFAPESAVPPQPAEESAEQQIARLQEEWENQAAQQSGGKAIGPGAELPDLAAARANARVLTQAVFEGTQDEIVSRALLAQQAWQAVLDQSPGDAEARDAIARMEGVITVAGSRITTAPSSGPGGESSGKATTGGYVASPPSVARGPAGPMRRAAGTGASAFTGGRAARIPSRARRGGTTTPPAREASSAGPGEQYPMTPSADAQPAPRAKPAEQVSVEEAISTLGAWGKVDLVSQYDSHVPTVYLGLRAGQAPSQMRKLVRSIAEQAVQKLGSKQLRIVVDVQGHPVMEAACRPGVDKVTIR